MNGYIIHNSLDEEYRRPLGAVPTGGKILLSLYIQNFENCKVKLLLNSESGCCEYEMQNNNEMFFANISIPQKPEVLWYRFFISYNDESFFYGPKEGENCGIGQVYRYDAPFFQLTIFEKNFKTPDFFKGSVMYQIFPDRFCCSGRNIKSGYEYHLSRGWKTHLHKDFSEKVDYLPKVGEDFYSPNDFFGGDLQGIEENLPYIKSLGTSVIYLNPIFLSVSNHRYDTADYNQIDAFLGNEEDFRRLCAKAESLGIKILLDGVFSHTGDESIYFKEALNGQNSPYYSWYTFTGFPNDYLCWWGFKSLPEVDEHDSSWQDFIIRSSDSVMKHWLKVGASGYRLDVADELPDDVIELMREAIKNFSCESFLLGEVWEDATTKQSYGVNRKYALGTALDSVMNYPLRTAIMSFLLCKSSAKELKNFLFSQQQNYSEQMYYCLMNLISSHDVERMRTVLAFEGDTAALSREEQAEIKISHDQDVHAAALMKLAAAVIMGIPGMPSIYYGDECGMHGLKDPFNRAPFKISDKNMLEYYKIWGKIRQLPSLKTGFAAFHNIGDDVLTIFRFTSGGKDAFNNTCDNQAALIIVNRSSAPNRICLDLHSFKFGISLEERKELCNIAYIEAVSLFSKEKYKILDGLLDMHIDGICADCLLLKRRNEL